MNYTQNERIAQVGDNTLVVGIDIGSDKYYARAFTERGIHCQMAKTKRLSWRSRGQVVSHMGARNAIQ